MSSKSSKPKTSSSSNGNNKNKMNGMVYAPSAQSKIMRTPNPSVSGSPFQGDGSVRIKHREYIQDVSGSVAFSASSIAVNPGLVGTFPWLSQIAAGYESYLFRQCSFYVETQKSSSTSGSVMLAIDFDASDSAPSSKPELMAFHNAVRAAVWAECCYRADSQDLRKFGVQRYLRSGSLASNLDIKTYDVGNLVVATAGCADTTAIGELYVEYDVELHTPQLNAGNALAAKIVGGGTVSRAAPFGTASVITGSLPVSASSATITFNRVGVYLVASEITGTVMTLTDPTLTGTASSSVVAVSARNGGATIQLCAIQVTVTAIGQTVIFDFTASSTTITASVTRIGGYANLS